MPNKNVYKLIYVDSDTEILMKLKKMIRTYALSSDIIININSCDTVEELQKLISTDGCDIVLLKHADNLPSIEEVSAVIDVTKVILLSLVADGELEASQYLIDKGAQAAFTMAHPKILYKQLMHALYARILQNEYKVARRRIHELETRAGDLLDSANTAIAYTMDGMFVYANRVFLDYFGFEEEDDLVGVLLLDLVSKESLNDFKAQIANVYKSKETLTLDGHFQHSKSGAKLETEYNAKQAYYNDELCLEIVINVDEKNVHVYGADTEVQHIVENSKLSFLQSLNHEIGMGSWLVSLTIDDYLKIWSEHGIILYESYINGVITHIYAQFRELNMVRYTDGSLMLVINDCDIISSDRISNMIANAVKSYVYSVEGGGKIQSNCSVTYASLESDDKGVLDTLRKIEAQSHLIPVVLPNQANYPNSMVMPQFIEVPVAVASPQMIQGGGAPANMAMSESQSMPTNNSVAAGNTTQSAQTRQSPQSETAINDTISTGTAHKGMVNGARSEVNSANTAPAIVTGNQGIDKILEQITMPIDNIDSYGEFSIIAMALNTQNIKLHYSPVADFTSNTERYLASYDLLDENGNIVLWNSAYMFETDNEVSQRLDLLLLYRALEILKDPKNINKYLILNLTGSAIKNQGFAEKFFTICEAYPEESKRLIFGLFAGLFIGETEKTQRFIDKSSSLGVSIGVYGINTPEEIDDLKNAFKGILFVSLNQNLVSRLSRLTDDNMKERMSILFEQLGQSNILVLSEGVDNPSAMAMVWDYSVPLATGKMLSEPLKTLDFDFSQMMM